jgi:large exoprotein involved in heme utilization and adhesion
MTEEVFLQVGFLTTFTRGPGAAGNIRLVTDSLRMTGDLESGLFSNIASRSLRSNAGRTGDIKIKAGNILLQDNLSIQTFTSGPGATGDITIEADSLQVLGVKGNVFISTSTFGAGSSGNLDIRAKDILLQGGSPGFTGLATQVNEFASGSPSAGKIRLITDSLQVLDGAQINTALLTGAGLGGDIEVHANTIRIAGLHPLRTGPSCLCAGVEGDRTTGRGGNIRVTANDLQVTDGGEINTFSDSLGNSGNINVQTKSLVITHGGFLASGNFGAGLSGDIDIRADRVHLAGPSPDHGFTGIFALGGASARNSGNIRIKTGMLEILDGSQIDNRTNGPGKGGNIEITAERMLIAGTDPRSISTEGIEAGIFATTIVFQDFVAQATGKAGNVLIQAGQLDLRDQGKISALSTSAGDGGNIDVLANRLTLTGGASITAACTGTGNAGNIHLIATNVFQSDNSSVTTTATQARGGDITISAPQIQLTNGAVISAESTGPGNAGSIHLMATDTFHSTGSTVTTEATQADGGNITVQARQLIQLRDSQITATVGGGPGTVGGNITIDPEAIVLENSQIRANAFAGRGGNVQITAGSSWLILPVR